MNDAQDAVPETPSLIRRRRPFLAPIWLLAFGAIAMLAAAFTYWNSATTTTIVLIRHAEKQVGAISDAPLSPPGEVRAARLAQMFGDATPFGRVQKIYVTDTRRTQQTAAGIAQRLALTPVIVAAKGGAKDLARRVLRENRGGRALVVGHSNTVPEIVAALTGQEDVPPIGDEEFDTLYVVCVPSIGRASVLRLKY
ncbi:MAG TPA: phosphoglycerate mutase family protein [Steroidobacteraceae bacterium]|nr:phosphoglycerate mutase family protein [Steroidobacteraceae bacterium]